MDNAWCSDTYSGQHNAPPPTEIDDKMEHLISRSRNLLDDDQVTKAIRIVMEAVEICPCDPEGQGKQRHGKDKSCHIIQCMEAVKTNDPAALRQVAECPCTCGYPWPSCNNPQHALALDQLANCLDKAKQYTAALSTALSTVRLDPTSAVGYCRGGRILRYLLRSHSNDPNTPEMRAAAVATQNIGTIPSSVVLRDCLVRFVEIGVRLTSRYRQIPKDRYDTILQRMAHHLRSDVARRDPSRAMPPELMSLTFSFLSISDLIRCMLVSRSWNRLVNQDGLLWSHLSLSRPGNAKGFFSIFLGRHPQIYTFIIKDIVEFGLSPKKLFKILKGMPELRQLHLGHKGAGSYVLEDPSNTWNVLAKRLSKIGLTHLSLKSIKGVHSRILPFCRASLRVLDLVDTCEGLDLTPCSSALNNLKFLRITNNGREIYLDLARFVAFTPNLEEFCVSGPFQLGRSDVSSVSHGYKWPRLRRLVIDGAVNQDFAHFADFFLWDPVMPSILPLMPKALRSIELLGQHGLASSILSDNSDLDYNEKDESFPFIEVFRCISSPLTPEKLKKILSFSARNNRLQVLDIALDTKSFVPATPTDRFTPKRDLDFLACDSLHTLGLHDFNFYHDPHSLSPTRFDGQPFVDWLDLFPNVHTVYVYPGNWDNVLKLISALINHPQIKVIYQNVLAGVQWDAAKAAAKEKGKELNSTKRYVGPVWPAENWV
ncbi:uncharacterized protein C8A04DRAFT_11618 [Dichotomopilus funicola]|uniref:F-box domain-containing protein n=1 Tax=Dichotomopilus funicola TaxID=1934379 RepID=A0AAN6V6B0_9PEZI|nr:hypothetical protein C8A04DRAFT_11618 [Dichotomopilus funicola]